MAPTARAMVASGATARISCRPQIRHAFRPQRPSHCSAPARRQELVIRVAEADRSREQDTVGDMSKDQVSAALERQLQRSKGGAGEAGSGSNGEVAAVEEAVEVVEREEPATDAEREESVRALEQLKGRVPLMSQDDIQSAIDRMIQRGGGAQAPSSSSGDSSSSSSDGAKSGASSSGSGSSSQGAGSGGGSSGGGKQGKYDADQTYEDGSLLFTAESLAAVSFEDLKP